MQELPVHGRTFASNTALTPPSEPHADAAQPCWWLILDPRYVGRAVSVFRFDVPKGEKPPAGVPWEGGVISGPWMARALAVMAGERLGYRVEDLVPPRKAGGVRSGVPA